MIAREQNCEPLDVVNINKWNIIHNTSIIQSFDHNDEDWFVCGE